MRIALCFDGQGRHDAQTIQKWIAKKPETQEWLQKIQGILSFNLKEIVFDERRANQLDYMQTLSFIWNQMLFDYYTKKIHFKPAFVFGHSLGHYNALVSAGVLSFEEALRIVEDRAALVTRAFSHGHSGMLYVKYSDEKSFAHLDTLCRVYSESGKLLEISILNSHQNAVVSYSGCSGQEAKEVLKEFAVKPLMVQAPYHSSAMKVIGTEFYQSIAHLCPKAPQISVLSNVTAMPISEVLCKKDLMRHLTCRLSMDACMRYCADQEVDTFVHLSLSGTVPTLLRMNCPECDCYHLADPDSEQAFFQLVEDHHRNNQEEYRKLLGEFSTIAGLPQKRGIDCAEIRNAMMAYQNHADEIGKTEFTRLQKLYGQACETI
jgi:[acyl-carrier-protein] S-malonyltransferase